MKIKFITETETLLDLDLPNVLSEKNEELLAQFDDRECVSFHVEFKSGVKTNRIHHVTDIEPEFVEQLTIKIK